MDYLFDICMQFWGFWFGGNLTDTTVLQLLSVVSTIAIVYGVIILPFLKIFTKIGGRRK